MSNWGWFVVRRASPLSFVAYFRLCRYICIFAVIIIYRVLVCDRQMATVIRQPGTFCFSSDISDIVFGTNDESAELVLTLKCGSARIELLSEIVYSDLSHQVSVVDISSMVEVFARQHQKVVLECSLTDSQGKCSISAVTVLFAMVDVGQSAQSFVDSHFLTILDGEKITAMGRDERLYGYGVSQLNVICDVMSGTGRIESKTCTLRSSSSSGGVSQFNVSPTRVASALGISGGLIGYRCEAGARVQKFMVVDDDHMPAPSLVFTNSFGCQEFLHCVGTHTKTSDYTRSTARIRGRVRNIRIEENRQFKANTGWLNRAMADWADDLFRSQEVYLWVDGSTGREVIITDSKSDISNDDNDMPAFEFTYSYVQRIHNVMQPKHAGRVFDNTFDSTFQ